MAGIDDVRRLALELPETDELVSGHGYLTWRVKEKGFVWERPLRKSDLAALGEAAPDGLVLCARVPDEGAKQALIADDPSVYFTTPHFNGFPAVLVQLERIEAPELAELVVEAWLSRAPKRLAERYQAGSGT